MLDVFKHLLPARLPLTGHADAGITAAAVPQRKTPRACDEALTGTTRVWLRRLPARRRPLRLCAEHPRVANRIAWCWRDVALTSQVLDDLLVDRRGGRRGFRTGIRRELQRLRAFNGQQRVETAPESFWSAVARVIGAD